METFDRTDGTAWFSIIIPVHNKAALTRQCLDVLLTPPSEKVPFEIIVVDDASTDEPPHVLASYGDRLRVVTHPANGGFARTCNDGAAAARGHYLVFLNNDTIPQTGWLDELSHYAETHPEVAAVGSKLLYPDNTIQHCGVAFGYDSDPRHIYAGFPADHPAVNKSRPFQAVTAACMLIRRSLFEQLGGFNTAYRNGYEDVDLCLRLGELGHPIHYCHQSVLYHLESLSRDVLSVQEQHNINLYRQRWAQRVRPDELFYYQEDELLIIQHNPLYPIPFVIHPLLGVVPGEHRDRWADYLLADRTKQVVNLLEENMRLVKENMRLKAQLQEVELLSGIGGVDGLVRPEAAHRQPGLLDRLLAQGMHQC